MPSGKAAGHVLLTRGYRLGDRYKLLYPYAQGGMATVWLSRVRGGHGFEKLFAVKTILPHLAKDEAFRAMFLDEARIIARIRHENVAEIEDLGEDAGVLYMVLEWVQGDPWSKLNAAVAASGHPVPSDVMLRIAAGACAGLHAAHELCDEQGRSLNVVHRDVSPQNVLVTEAGTVKVIDFGVAKAIGRSGEHTRAGSIKGKAPYMAPEQAKERLVDRRTDVWAMGAVLYEIFAGHAPYEASSELLVLQKIASGEPPEPLPHETPPGVVTLIERALEFHADRRFQTAAEMQHAIEACVGARVTPEEVAACMARYLGPDMATRRRKIAEALDEAAELSMIAGTHDLVKARSALGLPTLPPEASAPEPDAEATLAVGQQLVVGADRLDAAESLKVDLDLSELAGPAQPPSTPPAATTTIVSETHHPSPRPVPRYLLIGVILVVLGLVAEWVEYARHGTLWPF